MTARDENEKCEGANVRFHRQSLALGLSVMVAGCMGRVADAAPVRPGIVVLTSDSLHLLAGARVGLVTNQTGIGPGGRSDVELLLDAGVRLAALYSPEHGYRGGLDREEIGHSVDSTTGLPIYSLYGDTREPTPAMLEDVDVLVIDLQDIGARPYTYISTALLAMRAAQREQRRVIVLDRPNPIGGRLVQGPILDTTAASFVGMLPIPLRHGMTFGELALLGNDVLGIDADLTVIPAAGWHRGMWFDETELPWVRPSPNMPDLESATHYPGTVLFEGTNLSVGRGTPIAYQVVAAPWLHPAAVRGRVGEVPGLIWRDTVITPRAPSDAKYDGDEIPALLFEVSHRREYDPTALAVRLLEALLELHPGDMAFRPAVFDRLAGGDALRVALQAGRSAASIEEAWAPTLEDFRAERVRFLLYSDVLYPE